MKGFKTGNNKIQSRPRIRIVLKVGLGMIADARGVSKRTVQRAIVSGKLNPSDLMSVANYIMRLAEN